MEDQTLAVGGGIPVINLAEAPGERATWDRPRAVVYLWAIFELIFVTNPWQISSGLRVRVLRLFGAEIGSGVVFRPRTRVKFPWKLHVGDRSWIRIQCARVGKLSLLAARTSAAISHLCVSCNDDVS